MMDGRYLAADTTKRDVLIDNEEAIKLFIKENGVKLFVGYEPAHEEDESALVLGISVEDAVYVVKILRGGEADKAYSQYIGEVW